MDNKVDLHSDKHGSKKKYQTNLLAAIKALGAILLIGHLNPLPQDKMINQGILLTTNSMYLINKEP